MRLRVGEWFLVGIGVPVVGVCCDEWADYSDRGAAYDRGVWRRLSTLLPAGAQMVVKVIDFRQSCGGKRLESLMLTTRA